MTDQMIKNCEMECRHLAVLMTQFRDVCTTAEIQPPQWSGAGWLAAELLEKNGDPTGPLTAREISERAAKTASRNSKRNALRRPERDRRLEVAANRADYGGRFEVSRIGQYMNTI